MRVEIAVAAGLGLLALLFPNPASATTYVNGDELSVEWAPASGPVALYGVFVARNGEDYPFWANEYTTETRATVRGAPSDRLRIKVAAFSLSGRGPDSPESEEIVFAPTRLKAAAPFAAPFDLDGNGLEDSLWQTAGSLVAWLQRDGLAHDRQVFTGFGAAGFDLAGGGDFDGDGRADLLWRRSADGANLLQLARDAGGFELGLLPSFDASYSVAAVADSSGDGRDDIVWSQVGSGLQTLWQLDGADVSAESALGGYPAPWQIALARDFDGDGRDDLLWRDPNGGNLLLWRMQSPTRWEVDVLPSLAPRYRPTAAGDFDGDGRGDLLFEDDESDAFLVWIAETGGSFRSWVLALGAGWSIAGASDVDGDGRSEALLRHAEAQILQALSLGPANIDASVFLGSPPDPAAVRFGP